jgi:NADPH:quinone reductase-like Zn-dependent oxidoreductase
LERSWGILRRSGVLVTVAGDAPEEKAAKYGVRGVSFLVQPNRIQLNQISQLIDSGTVHSVVEATYPLDRAREAYERGLLGHNRGKLVLQVLSEPAPFKGVSTTNVGGGDEFGQGNLF